MDLHTNTASALLAAVGMARDHGGAAAALAAAGMDLPPADHLEGLPGDLGELFGRSAGDAALAEALALGYLAGQVAPRARARTSYDPTAFLMDRDLVCQRAEGESILRLPWFDDGLFVGRQIPDIREMPLNVRRLCIEHYSAGLHGERSRFEFTSYGHAYTVDAVPVYEEGEVRAVLGVATPDRCLTSAAGAYDRTADRLERAAVRADRRAELQQQAGRDDAAELVRREADRARQAAGRARANAERLRLRERPADPAGAPAITQREAEILSLASHGLTHADIAEQLTVTATTVRTHLENVYPKLGVSNKAAAVAAALRHGLID